jgi:thiamine pyrophosphate-dependent acetolactate synthase large subunit-like protein
MAHSKRFSGARREFIKRAAAAGAALAAPGAAAEVTAAQQPATPALTTAESPLTEGRSGSDFMVDAIKSLGIEYVCSNTGSSFRGLQESVVNYGGNEHPEFLTCCHEESSVAMAHGYFKVEGKPLCVMAHGTVGLQHAAMAIYNAYVDRVPAIIVIGNTADADKRQPPAEWYHSVQDAASMVRDYTKWDDQPASLQHFAESMVRGYKVAVTPPMGPVVLVADAELQERPIPEGLALRVPKLNVVTPPQGDSGAVTEAAKLLVAAANPVLVAERLARTPEGITRLVELAELVQAAVVSGARGRMNFPSRHPLNQTLRTAAVISDADVIVGLEVMDFWGTVNSVLDLVERRSKRLAQDDVKLVHIGVGDLTHKANYQDFQRYAEVDLAIAGDAEATLPSLIEAVKRLMTPDRRQAIQARGTRLAAASKAAIERARTDATYAWDASPISTGRVSAEVWAQIEHEDWSLVNNGLASGVGAVPVGFWNFTKHYQFLGGSGGAGIGYGAPASVGAALANRKYGRLSVTIQADGDLMYAPGVLWTAAHHKIPLLAVMHNNRAYHQEMMHIQKMGNRRNRGVDRAHIGTSLDEPAIDFAKLAQSMGWYAEGPITQPNDLAPAIKRALAVVKRGEPALLDVVTQPR